MIDSLISLFVTIAPFVALGISYFLLLSHKNNSNAAKNDDFAPGERVLTTGGVVGYISKYEGNFAILEMYDGSLIEVHKTALAKKCT
jgi:preprotein translocase YajC subunit